MIETIIQKIDTILQNENFERLMFKLDKKTKFCFDFLVKKDNNIFLIKVFPNIDNLNENIIDDIKALSLLLNSKPLLIGLKNRYQSLEDNTIYIREDLPFININTLENIIKIKVFPEILARRGGGVLFIDGNLMKDLREKRNITRKEISLKLGVTKRTICAYENESMRPSQKVGNKILELLEDQKLFKKINLFEWNIKFNFEQKDIFKNSEDYDFESHLQDIISDIGISTYWYKKGQVPFELSIFAQDSKIEGRNCFYPIFSGITEKNKKVNANNTKQLLAFTKLFQKKALIIVDNQVKIPGIFLSKKIPFIKVKHLAEIDDEEEFIDIIQDIHK